MPFRAPLEVLCDEPIDARLAGRLGGFGQFGGMQFFSLGCEPGAAQRGPGRQRLVGVDHGLGSRLRAWPAATSTHNISHALAERRMGFALEPVYYPAQLGAA